MTVRILLGTIGEEWKSTLLELVRADRDLEIVGSAEDAIELLLKAERLKADVVVLAQAPDGGEPGICSHLMLEYPNVAVMLLPHDPGGEGLWRMVLRKETWKHVSKEVLRSALKRSPEEALMHE